MLVVCIPTITEHLVVAVQSHHFNSQSECNKLGVFVDYDLRRFCFSTFSIAVDPASVFPDGCHLNLLNHVTKNC